MYDTTDFNTSDKYCQSNLANVVKRPLKHPKKRKRISQSELSFCCEGCCFDASVILKQERIETHITACQKTLFTRSSPLKIVEVLEDHGFGLCSKARSKACYQINQILETRKIQTRNIQRK